MNHNATQGPLARFGRRVAAIVAECNYAQTRVDSLRNTPDAYQAREILAPEAGSVPVGGRVESRGHDRLAFGHVFRLASSFVRAVGCDV